MCMDKILKMNPRSFNTTEEIIEEEMNDILDILQCRNGMSCIKAKYLLARVYEYLEYAEARHANSVQLRTIIDATPLDGTERYLSYKKGDIDEKISGEISGER